MEKSELEHKLGMDRVRESVSALCSRVGSEREVENMSFEKTRRKVERMLLQTEEMMNLLEDGEIRFPRIGSLDDEGRKEDVTEVLKRLKIERLSLNVGDLVDVRKLLREVVEVKAYVAMYVERRDREGIRQVQELSDGMEENGALLKAIDNVIDERGEVKDDASVELRRIRRESARERNRVGTVMSEVMRDAKKRGVVDEDARVSIRDGRSVLPVRGAMKSQVSGIVHDESSSGNTFFIEPAEVVAVNNRIRELMSEERDEVMRILRELTERIRPYTESLLHSAWVMDQLDFWKAKAMWCKNHRCQRVEICDEELDFRMARHPLLEDKLGRVVPMSLRLDEGRRMLLVSGPNAGGKSVCLKTVGLLQWMTQCGMLVPVEKGSRTRLFHEVMVDIGDEQSIENSLSTYSSHLMNMKRMAQEGDGNTLLLIDEMGSGTEPRMGGAIAEALLEYYRKKGMWCVVTTHYDNLKHWASDAEGVVNGAMAYDRGKLMPLFELQVGSAGSSFAVEIARKIGLPEEVVEDAIARAGEAAVNYDKHLQEVARDKRYWADKREQVRRRAKRAEEMEGKLQEQLEDVEKQKRQLLREAKQEARRLIEDANARIERTIREIKESQADKARTKVVRDELKQAGERIEEALAEEAERTRRERLNEEAENGAERKSENASVDRSELREGDLVQLQGQAGVAKVIAQKGNVAEVQLGQLRLRAKTNELTRISKGQAKKIEKTGIGAKVGVNSPVENMRRHRANFSTQLDIRGERAVDAMEIVSRYIDDAVMLNMGVVRILHGTGTGALRQVVRDYLKNLRTIRSYHDEDVRMGGAGITVVEL